VYPKFEDCSTPRTLTQSTVPDTVQVLFDSIGPGLNRIITFTSNVGKASFATGIP
jgi:hypothetical protein